MKTRLQTGRTACLFLALSACGSADAPAAKSGQNSTADGEASPGASASNDATSILGSSALPAAFVGEWNASPESCGTGTSDTRLRIEPTRIRFYESVGQISRITVQGRRSVTVEASFRGEGERWTREFQMILSPSGDALTIDGLTRQRCR